MTNHPDEMPTPDRSPETDAGEKDKSIFSLKGTAWSVAFLGAVIVVSWILAFGLLEVRR